MDKNDINTNQEGWKGRSPSTNIPSHNIIYDPVVDKMLFYYEDYKDEVIYNNQLSKLFNKLQLCSDMPTCLLQIITHLATNNVIVTTKSIISSITSPKCNKLINQCITRTTALVIYNHEYIPVDIFNNLIIPLSKVKLINIYYVGYQENKFNIDDANCELIINSLDKIKESTITNKQLNINSC